MSSTQTSVRFVKNIQLYVGHNLITNFLAQVGLKTILGQTFKRQCRRTKSAVKSVPTWGHKNKKLFT